MMHSFGGLNFTEWRAMTHRDRLALTEVHRQILEAS